MLRKVARLVDFDFVYAEVKESYGYNGNVSMPPPMTLKLMLLWVLYNIGSERGVDGDVARAAMTTWQISQFRNMRGIK
ncbi:MAG: hypothetical protein HYU31_14655 [Deltaproteobacteria bacterium]|nr:hypothetical protein [Deltaproteobacteria bacterium]MBI2182047.1 hypothetical protein [Deltaproteobacteria bacterium]MBI2228575.1 hypothetical protein [Deltaproteobacteria bacterium]MBI2363534.1 hypothetical protein [Deltaproteobacteria bacterium]MBI2533150.1 hypothetical protein [Deltaproteobacteria bacterium]